MFQLRKLSRAMFFVGLLGWATSPARAQIESIAPLKFVMLQGSSAPLPQLLAVASTGSNTYYSAVASTNTGGNWLTVPSGSIYTPTALAVSVNATVASSLGAGTYSGQVVVTASGTSQTLGVTLTVDTPNTASFANLPGGLTFARANGGGGGSGSQVIQVNSAGTGSLSWTLTTSTFNGANFITVSATSGIAPSMVSIGIAPQNLPGGGITNGTFTGQLVFASSSGSVTIPVAVSVGVQSLAQASPLSFAMPVGGAAPLPQVVPGASSSSNFYFGVSGYTGTGGNWLTVPSTASFYTPGSPEIGISQSVASSLPVGVYTGEVVVSSTSSGASPTMVIPVTLTVSALATPFFDNMPGGMNFYLSANGGSPGGQTLQIRSAGSGALNWTATTSTGDGGNWLSVSPASGTATSLVAVQVAAANLPGAGATGTYSGSILFQSPGSSVTIPITVSVGTQAILPVDPINVSMPLAGQAPVIDAVTIDSTGSGFYYNTDVHTATGGNWLNASTTSGSAFTPSASQIGFNQTVVSALPAGSYTGEVIYSGNSAGSAAGMTVPVTLTVTQVTGAFFDNLPGGLQFSLAANGASPGSQVIQVRNAGSGTLKWSVTTSTDDGGKWLVATPASATAPSLMTVSVVSQNLPGAAAAGIYQGTILLQSPSGNASVPVTVVVGGTGFAQINPLSFQMPANGAAPLPQSVSVSSTGSGFYFTATPSTATGGNWLTVAQTGNLYTPEAITVVVNQNVASSLPAGSYTGEVVLSPINSGSEPVTLPVTLTIQPPNVAFFDSLPGGLQFTLQPQGGNPSSQIIQVQNGGVGALNWAVNTSTADGGSWLTVSRSSGVAPTNISVGVLAAKLPGGAATGTYNGSLLFENGAQTVSIPITVSVGVTALSQVNPIAFTMPLQGSIPLPQEVPINALTSTGYYLNVSGATASGGNWLQVTPTGTLFPPQSLTISVNQAVASSLAAGTYSAEINLPPNGTNSSAAGLTIPVTLTIAPPSGAFFDNVPGGLYFAQLSGVTSQTISIRNEGSGTLSWNAIPTTADGGAWLTVSQASGSGPSTLNVSVLPQYLPGQGSVSGTFTGQVLLESANGNVTVPVTVNTSTGAFTESNGLVFNTTGSSSQNLTVTTGVQSESSFTGNGGNWLSVTRGSGGIYTFAVNAAGLSAGSYTGEAIFLPSGGQAGQTVQVTLNVSAGTAPQTITFNGLAAATYGGGPIALIANASSGLPVSFGVSGPAVITGSSLAITGTGTVTLTASQPGNSTYAAATPVLQSFTVAPAVLTVNANEASHVVGYPNPSFGFTISGFVNGDTATVVSGSAVETTAATSSSPAGVYPITFATENLTASNYIFTYVNGSLVVTPSALQVGGVGSSSLFASETIQAYQMAVASGGTNAGYYIGSNAGQVNDQRGTAGVSSAIGSLSVAWDNAAVPQHVWYYLSVDSAVANRAFFSAPRARLGGITNAVDTSLLSASFFGGNAPQAIPAAVLAVINNSAFTAAFTDVRPEDALFAENRVNCGNASSTSLSCLGYGGPNPSVGTSIQSGVPGSNASAQPIAYNIFGSDPVTNQAVPSFTTIPIGVSPLVFIANRSNSQGLGNSAFSGVTYQASAVLLFGGFNCDTSAFGVTSPLTAVYPILRDPMSGAMNVFEYNFMLPLWSPYARQDFWFSQEGYLYSPYFMPGPNANQVGSWAALGLSGFPGTSNPLNGGCPVNGTNNFWDGGSQGKRIRAIGVNEVTTEIQNQTDSIGYVLFNYADLANLAANPNYGYLTYGQWSGGTGGALIPTDPINPSGNYNVSYINGNLNWPGNGQIPVCNGPCPVPPNTSFPNVRNGAYLQWSVLRAVGDQNNAITLATLNALTSNMANGVNATLPDFVPFNPTASGDNGLQFYRSHFSPAGINYSSGNVPNNGVSSATGQYVPNTESGGDVGGCVDWRYAPNGPTNLLNCRY